MNIGMKLFLTVCVCCLGGVLLPLAGCEKKSPPPAFDYPQHGAPTVLLREKTNTTVVETTAGALPIWRNYGDVKPTLVILSSKTLAPVNPQSREEVAELLSTGTAQQIRNRMAVPFEPSVLINSDMAVGAAIVQHYFSGVVWVVPVAEGQELKLGSFVQLMQQRAELWGEYLETFTVKDGIISGNLGGVPVRVVSLAQLPQIAEPVLFHFDTGFLLPLYKGEIKTPIYPLLKKIAGTIAEKGYRVWEATVSHDNLSDDLPLKTRFVANEMARYLTRPAELATTPRSESLRAEALYLENFMQREDIFKDYHELKKLVPEDASAWYGEYLALRDVRQPDAALQSLDKAVTLDPVYGYEYRELAELAMEKERPEKAIEMIDKAIAALPQDPFLRLEKARLLRSTGAEDEAKALMEELSRLPWSPVYFPEVRAEIESLF